MMVPFPARLARAIVVGALAAVPAVASAAAPATPGLMYGGDTSAGEAMTVEVNPAGTQVTRAVFTWTADCTAGPAATPTTSLFTGWTESRGPFPINAATGAWKKTLVIRTSEGAVQQVFDYVFVGRRVGGTMRGTIQATLTEKDVTGQVIRTCASGSVKFALKGVNVFGGLTSAKDPIVITTNPAGTTARRLRWDWRGTCIAGAAAKPDTSLEIAWRDFLTDFPVDASGRFGFTGKLKPEAIAEVGVTRTFTYKVVARRTGQTIKGSISSSFDEIETATGALVRSCKSAGPVTFRAKN